MQFGDQLPPTRPFPMSEIKNKVDSLSHFALGMALNPRLLVTKRRICAAIAAFTCLFLLDGFLSLWRQGSGQDSGIAYGLWKVVIVLNGLAQLMIGVVLILMIVGWVQRRMGDRQER